MRSDFAVGDVPAGDFARGDFGDRAALGVAALAGGGAARPKSCMHLLVAAACTTTAKMTMRAISAAARLEMGATAVAAAPATGDGCGVTRTASAGAMKPTYGHDASPVCATHATPKLLVFAITEKARAPVDTIP